MLIRLRSAFLFIVTAYGIFPAIGLAVAVGCSDDESPPVEAAAGSAGSVDAGAMAVAGSGGAAGAGGSTGGTSGSGGAAGAGLGGSSFEVDAGTDAAVAVAFALSSPDFEKREGCGPTAAEQAPCDFFPNNSTPFGADQLPALNWTSGPEGTQSYALAFHDLNTLDGDDPLTHWVLWNIPGTEQGLAAALLAQPQPGVPAANTEQRSIREDDGFTGASQGGNVYEFVLYALSSSTFDTGTEQGEDAIQALFDASDSVLATVTLRARSNP